MYIASWNSLQLNHIAVHDDEQRSERLCHRHREPTCSSRAIATNETPNSCCAPSVSLSLLCNSYRANKSTYHLMTLTGEGQMIASLLKYTETKHQHTSRTCVRSTHTHTHTELIITFIPTSHSCRATELHMCDRGIAATSNKSYEGEISARLQ